MPAELPPLRMLLVWDNLAGHKTAAMVVWLCQHGVMPLYTPLGGSWLNMAESIQRILKRRTLDGQHPRSPAEIGAWFRADRRGLEPATHALPVERQAPAEATEATRRPTRARRLGRSHAEAALAARPQLTGMAQSEASDPLVFLAGQDQAVPLAPREPLEAEGGHHVLHVR